MKKIALCVAEKPSVAKAIVQFLSTSQMALNAGHQEKKMGRSKFNPVYEFDLKLNSGVYRMRVTSVLGHVMTTKFPDTHSDWITTDLMSLYQVPLERVP